MQDSSTGKQSDSEQESFLPSPYNSPWKALSQDLRAVSADLRLRTQEIWRRNYEGNLSVPAFWPRTFAPLFWPVLLILATALLIVGGLQLCTALSYSKAPSPPEVERVQTTALPKALPKAKPLPSTGDIDSIVKTEAAITSPVKNEADDLDVSVKSSAPIESVLEKTSLNPDPKPMRFDPLLRFLADDRNAESTDGSALIVSAQPEPERNAVTLTINAAQWIQLSKDERHQLADGWWERLEEQGYGDLRLINAEQDLLARPARIGGGMIVLNPNSM